LIRLSLSRKSRVLTLVLTCGIATALVLSMLKPLASYDAGWNIRMGQWIWDNGQLPRDDPLLFTSSIATPNFPLLSGEITESQQTKDTVLTSHWLGQVAFYAVWSIDDIVGPVILRLLLFTLTILCIVFTLRTLKLSWAWSLMGGITGLALLQGYIMARPSLFSITLLALSMLLWARFWMSGNKWWCWFAVALLPLWAQLHAGFLYGVVLALAWSTGLIGQRLLIKGGVNDNKSMLNQTMASGVSLGFIHLALLAVVAIMASLCTYPPGVSGLLGFYRDLSQMPSLSDEMSPVLYADEPLFYAIVPCVALMLTAGWRYIPLPMWLILAGVTIAPFMATRNIALFAGAGVPILFYGFQRVMAHYYQSLRSPEKQRSYHLLLGVLALAPSIELIRTNYTINNDFQAFTWNKELQPVELAEFIKKYRPPGRPMHPYHLGGYLELAIPEVQWFADGRYYKPKFITYANNSTNDFVLLQKMAEYYQIDWVILPVFTPAKQLSMGFVNVAADPLWLPVEIGGNFALFVRKGEQTIKYLSERVMSYEKWHDSLLGLLKDGGLGLIMADESQSASWLALYLTLAGYIGDKYIHSNIMAPESILANVPTVSPGYEMSRAILQALPSFQKRAASMLIQLPGGEGFVIE